MGEGISGRPKLFIAPSGRRPGEVWLPVIDREWPDVRGGDEPRGFNVRPSVQAGEVIVEVVGELDLATAPLLDEVLLGAGAVATGRVVVDVSHLTFMGAAGLSVLVGAHYRLLGKRREGLVVRGASGIVRRVVEVTALSFLLEDPDAAGAAGAVPCQGFGCHNLEVGRRVAGLSVTDLFVAYFALGALRTSVRCVRSSVAWMMPWPVISKTWQSMRSTSGWSRWGTGTAYCRMHRTKGSQGRDSHDR